MRWLIVEDALRDRKGHWFEYLGTFARELRALGDEVTLLADHAAEPFLVEQLAVRPVLPASIWHRMSDGAGAARRYLRVPFHAWQTYRTLKKYLRQSPKCDVIFVPTVLVHHLLGWTWLIQRVLKNSGSKVLLFFPNTPIYLDESTGEPKWQPSPTSKLFARLVHSLRMDVEKGHVILGAETHPMCTALTQLTGVKFTYFPHPVSATADLPVLNPPIPVPTEITMGSYGSARAEKGEEVLVAAVEEYCRRFPNTRARFVLQNVDGNKLLWQRLEGNPKVRLIQNYFADGGYARQLVATNVLLLPYRRSSYDLRVSRVVIEAMIHGLPVVATQGTTLASQAEEFGAAEMYQNGSVESLVGAIHQVDINYESLAAQAREHQMLARQHFSVSSFRKILVP